MRSLFYKIAVSLYTVQDIKRKLREANDDAFEELASIFAADMRASVQKALTQERKVRIARQEEKKRVSLLYAFEEELAKNFLAQSAGAQVDALRNESVPCILGMDEVGRGPIAGPLVVGGVVLKHSDDARILGLNDSKKLSAKKREELSETIKEQALVYALIYISAQEIDEKGISACLKKAFSSVIKKVESAGISPKVCLLDGNPLHIDEREVNVVSGDAKCASISAASIIAKVERDAYMVRLAKEFPQYNFESNKGYGSKQHMDAVEKFGLSPYHRKSFCTRITQPSLFDCLE